jgi:hypothetical protein
MMVDRLMEKRCRPPIVGDDDDACEHLSLFVVKMCSRREAQSLPREHSDNCYKSTLSETWCVTDFFFRIRRSSTLVRGVRWQQQRQDRNLLQHAHVLPMANERVAQMASN